MMRSACMILAFAGTVLLPSICNAAPRPYNVTNRTAAAITSITAINNANPGNVISFALSSPVAMAETSTATIDLPTGVCLFDLTFTLANATSIIQPDVDLCNIDGYVVE